MRFSLTASSAFYSTRQAALNFLSKSTSTSTTTTSSKFARLSTTTMSAHYFSTNSNENPLASRRGQEAVQLLPSYLSDARAVERYHPTKAPHGALQLGVAESQLVEDWITAKMNQLLTEVPFEADLIYYQPTAGRPAFRQAVANYMQELLMLEKQPDVEGIIVGAGCNAVLENLCFTLTDPGDTVLIPTPYYAAFEFDLVARAGCQIMPVTTMDYANCGDLVNNAATIPVEAYYPTKQALDAAYQRSNSKPKILLLSHPHNPLGISYPPHVIQDCIDWCRQNQVHLISDEIYAGSVYRPEQANFVSTLKLASGNITTESVGLGLGPYIHWVYALSKDFALSGMRVGVAYSENQDIRLPFSKLNDMCQISAHTQSIVQAMMTTRHTNTNNNELWTTAFRKTHQERLNQRSDRLQTVLTNYDIPHVPASCGLFVWLDLSEFLPTQQEEGTDAERERSLYLTLMNEFGLLLTPGLSMRNERPGFFRFVFSAASEEEYDLALKRLETFFINQRS